MKKHNTYKIIEKTSGLLIDVCTVDAWSVIELENAGFLLVKVER